VDTSSIIGQGITPSAVFRGVNSGDDTISKYRINSSEDTNENIDWRKTIKNASRAAVDEPDEVMAQKIIEPSVQVSHQQHYNTRPANVGPLPSEQLRHNPEALSRPTPPTSPTIVPRQPSQPVVSPKSGNVPPPPGPSRTVYTPPQQVNPKRGVTVVAESTIRPSLLRDTSDPLERYRINDTATDSNEGNPTSSASGPKTDTSNDPLQKYRVRTAEEEETTWHFYLSNLTGEPGKPVELLCDGQVVFFSEGANGIVNTHASYAAIGDATTVVLNIKSIPYTVNKNLEISKGRFVKFAIEKGVGALRFRQQRTEIDD